MPKRQALTVPELKSLLLARFHADQRKQMKLQALLHQALGNNAPENPLATTINSKLADWIFDILARRLKRNRRSTPLLSSRDFVRFVPSILLEIERTTGMSLDVESSEMFKKYMKSMFDGIFESMQGAVLSSVDPEEYRRWITIILNLASERGVTPVELFSTDEAVDEMTRRVYTKRQFTTVSKRATSRLTSADFLKKIIFQPILDMVEGDEEYRRALTQELEVKLMPHLHKVMEKCKAVIDIWNAEEIKRIYKTK